MDSPGSKSAKRPCISPSSPDTAPKTSIGNQIFCNRPLYMKSIKAVGFDMDYTLAQYKVDTFESLVYQQTVQNLVSKYSYPSEVCLLNLMLILSDLIIFVLFLMQVMIEAVLYFFGGVYLLTLNSSTLSRDVILFI